MSTESATSTPPADEPLAELPHEEFLARVRLLDWISDQIAAGAVTPADGDCILATDGRILGHGPDRGELFRRLVAAEPALGAARIVASWYWPHDLLPETVPCPDSDSTSGP
ncbi:MAG: hypothetical protein K2X82_03030 [Gemmataceae bacterium]|nr:hypothetical protein [Gemmataceae bacterium]